MQEYIFKLDEKDKEALGNVRCMPNLQAAVDPPFIWLRGIVLTSNLAIELRQLPVKTTFIIDEFNRLFIPGNFVPVDELKKLDWQPLIRFIDIEPPTSALPGKVNHQVNIKLVPSTNEKEGSALVTTLAIWKAYAANASAIRLQSLEFAVSSNNEVFILGTPLPSLPGKEFWKVDDLFIPAGYDFEIPLVVPFISKKLNPQKEHVLVFDIDGSYQTIENAFIVQAKRSAAKLTKGNHD